MFEIKNLSKAPILQDITLCLKRGEVAVLLGGSGAGKTTFLRALNKLEKIDEGTVLFEGNPLDKGDIGMVFQHFNLFEHLTVEENVTLALMKTQKKEKKEAVFLARQLLERYQLAEKGNLNVKKLSGGQKQRLAIARTLALSPEIICLDEPTSALDPLLTAEVASYIKEMGKENKIVLLTTHDMGLLKALDARILFMQRGQIVENAKKKEIEDNPSCYPFLSNFLQSGS